MRSLAKQTKDTDAQRMPMLQVTRNVMLLPLVLLMILVADARFINPLQNSASARGHAIGKREVLDKKLLTVTNFDNASMKDHLSNHNLAIVEELDIRQGTLNSVKFLEGLNFPALKSIKLTEIKSEPSKTNIMKSTRPAKIKARIKWSKTLDNLEINTNNVFEGINSLVEKTSKFLAIPLPVFIQMHGLGIVNLVAESLKFTHVNVSDLLKIKEKSRNGKPKNTSLKNVLFVTDGHIGPLKGEATTEIINGVFAWMRVVFRDIRCINIEEKDFAEPTVLRRVCLKNPILPEELPDLYLICINELIFHIRYDSNAILYFKNPSKESLYKHTSLSDIVSITDVPNIMCIEIIFTENVERYLIRQYHKYPAVKEIVEKVIKWCKLNKKETIEKCQMF